MPSSTITATTPLQPHHLRNLILILRRANAHYTHVASCIRASLTPTRHAKIRAQNLGLTVDIVRAVNCPHKAVSVIPLPIIEAVTPPLEYIRQVASSVIQRRPALTCTIPTDPVVQTITSPNGTTSALSTGSAYSSITLTSALQAASVNASRSHWSATTDDDERFPRDATIVGARSVRAAQPEPAALWQPLDIPIDEDAMVWDLDLQYPEDSSAMDISPITSDPSVSSTTVSPSSSPSSGSEAGSESSDTSESSVSSSVGPVTPPTGVACLPLKIRIKRKSMEIRDIDEIEDDNMSDKRVRVFHSDPSQTQRRNVIRIPARR
ncbi:hypothetical protein DXG01_012240 [Tephrocybe rancida]|nr:hypothetical protein DXG01_012240 [Tephrocybe rancida]